MISKFVNLFYGIGSPNFFWETVVNPHDIKSVTPIDFQKPHVRHIR